MGYIRSRTEELTGYQASGEFRPSVDFGNDFVMVYGIGDTMAGRIRQYREKGYVVHLMTGIAWGEYQDYLDGYWDGRKHWDEGQADRDGNDVSHGPGVPYMVPTVAFSEYLTERLKIAVDSGVEAIHMEEPEFWDRSGYSEAFKREYEIYYKESYRPQYENLDVRYKSAKLKAYLYCRTIERVSAALKEYAKVKYRRALRFYVPTHSLLNYSQWKIISPEAALINIPTVDGYIAQVWTGTSRVPNVYEGVYKERTFETAYLEYGVMQELVKGTGRRMWFLNDPVEDLPAYTWEDYRYNYIKTATASLLHPDIWHYEICPWPHRVFEGRYPKFPSGEEGDDVENQSKPIPQAYATLLSGMFQMFGDMEQPEYIFEGVDEKIGVFMSDSAMFQRTFPDGIVGGKQLGKGFEDFIQSAAFPQFFGLSLPLLKYGLPIKPVQLDNVRRFAGYLDDYRLLVLSYEFIKPEGPDVNATLVSWVQKGGTLIYVGDGSDPFHQITSWWRQSGYGNPAQHLFETAGVEKDPADGVYQVGEGRIAVWNIVPARICLDSVLSDQYRELVKKTLAELDIHWQYRSDLTLHRGPYIVSSVMDESCSADKKVFTGLFADMLENDYSIIHKKEIGPDECALLFDFSAIREEEFRVIGTSARVVSADLFDGGAVLRLKTADRIKAFTRLRLPKKSVTAVATDERNVPVDVTAMWDSETNTLLISYDSHGDEVTVKVYYEK